MKWGVARSPLHHRRSRGNAKKKSWVAEESLVGEKANMVLSSSNWKKVQV